MRTPQRNFVVEYKSGRRRLGKMPNAIWGDTDFKALVDEAEADAPHLFAPKVPSEASGQGCEATSTPELKTDNVDSNEISADRLVPASLTNIDEVSAANPEPVPTGEDLPQSDEKLSEPHPKAEPKKRRKALPRLQVDKEINTSTAASIAQPQAPSDELAVLQEENSLLRSMLAKRLHAENSQLRSMLERFIATAIS